MENETRATTADVKAIFETSETDLDQFIIMANLVIDGELLSEGYSEARLTQIEILLSAHFAYVLNPTKTEEKIGDVAVKYDRTKAGMGLDETPYGRRAKLLDSHGVLAGLENAKVEATMALLWESDLKDLR